MKQEKMIRYMNLIDSKYIAEADPANAKNIKRNKIQRRVLRLGTIAACFICVIGVLNLYVWLFVPNPSTEQLKQTVQFRLEDKLASYEILDVSRWQDWTLEKKIGETIVAESIYRIKDSDNLLYLIRDKGDGTYDLLKFEAFSAYLPDLHESYYYQAGILTEEDLEQLSYNTTYTYGEVLDKIYGITSAKDIVRIFWQKTDFDNSKVGKSVRVDRYVMKDDESIERFYGIMCDLVRERHETDAPVRIFSNDEAYLSQEMPLCAQTEREVLIQLKNGEEIRFYYSPTGNCLYENGVIRYEPISNENNEWLIDTVGINMSWVDYGVNINPSGAETAYAPPVSKE